MKTRKYTYPFNGIYSLGSDCDMMSLEFLEKFHYTLNIKLGLNLTNSFWIYQYQMNDMLSLFKSPNEFITDISSKKKNYETLKKSMSNEIINHYHRILYLLISNCNYNIYYFTDNLVITYRCHKKRGSVKLEDILYIKE